MREWTSKPAILFDLDGTLVDTVYSHVLAWQEALEEMGIELSVWRIHRKVGMSGGLLTRALLRETGSKLSADDLDRLRSLHLEAFIKRADRTRPLPGARELLDLLSRLGVPWAIATSGNQRSAQAGLVGLRLQGDFPLVTRDQVAFAKPNPDLFLAAADLLGAAIERSIVVGDSVWDMLAARRAPALGVGLLSGGYGRDELERAGAFRVYEDPADLLAHLDELGIRVDSP
jgi:HAD superfamily hydrolase (TIGR01549 family)